MNFELRSALSRWDGEGGALRPATRDVGLSDGPALTNTEIVQLRVRVIALENLVIGMLAESSRAQRASARDMACHIAPRPGFTRHPMTLRAAAQILHCVERAELFSAEHLARATGIADPGAMP